MGVLFSIRFFWCKQDVISPAPPHELTKLLEDHEVQDATCAYFIIIVTWNLIPVESFDCLREGQDEGYR